MFDQGSKDVFPSNTAAHFKTRLATPISLVGEWDVALYEIHYKRLWHAINPIDAEIIYEIEPPARRVVDTQGSRIPISGVLFDYRRSRNQFELYLQQSQNRTEAGP